MRASSSTKSKPKPAPLNEVKDLLLRKKSPVKSTINSARFIPKKSMSSDENISFEFTKAELEQRLQEFLEFIMKNKTLGKTNPSSYLNELRNIFSVLSKSNQKPMLTRANSSEIKSKELSSLIKEAEMHRQIKELEEYKATCQQKIDNHALYIIDLEKKVDILIREYERTLTINQTLTYELEASKYETSIMTGDDHRDQVNTSLFAEIEESRKKTAEYHKDIKQARITISDLEAKLKQSSVFEEHNRHLREEMQLIKNQLTKSYGIKAEFEANCHLVKELKQENQSLKEALEKKSEEVTQLENKFIKQSVQQEQKINTPEKENAKPLTQLQESSTLNLKELETKLLDSEKRIESLTSMLQKATENFEQSQSKCAMLEIELESKERLEALTKALRKKIETLETQVESLTEDKIKSQTIGDSSPSNIVLSQDNQVERKDTIGPCLDFEDFTDKLCEEKEYNYSYIKNLVSPKGEYEKEYENTLRETLEKKEKELEDERASFKTQIEKYGVNLTMLTGKIQALVKINESMGKDFEYLKYDYKNYRAAIWSVYQEIRRQLDAFRAQDFEVESFIDKASSSSSESFESLLNFYSELRRKTVTIDNLVESRRYYI